MVVSLQEISRAMSKNINVNPGQYKVAGRERLGENLDQEKDKQALAKSRQPKNAKPSQKKR